VPGALEHLGVLAGKDMGPPVAKRPRTFQTGQTVPSGLPHEDGRSWGARHNPAPHPRLQTLIAVSRENGNRPFDRSSVIGASACLASNTAPGQEKWAPAVWGKRMPSIESALVRASRGRSNLASTSNRGSNTARLIHSIPRPSCNALFLRDKSLFEPIERQAASCNNTARARFKSSCSADACRR
jgi:hypothetical protein